MRYCLRFWIKPFSNDQLEELGEALLDFSTQTELLTWL
ncbi:DUF4351 domain-containing protein [Kovacikia minuta CCNUW1]|nr:DUF4351 domain-containing protein [Kovacikia minuta]UBF27478.1 DUF4351 domain-containing protein [Kovacikia minuta CCNUW1]